MANYWYPKFINGGGGGNVESVTGVPPIVVDNTDPDNPVISYQALQTLATFTNDVNVFEFGATIAEVNFAWTYNRNGSNPTSQSINQGIGARPVGTRAYTLNPAGLSNTTTWTISAIGDDGTPSSRTTTATETAKVYSGVDQAVINTGAGIIGAFAASGVFDANIGHTYTYDASAGGGANYLYAAWPDSYGAPSNVTFNGFDFNDYTIVVDSLTNASGGTQDYQILRTNQVYSGAAITLVIF